jgi:hypothetical protein
MQNGKRQRAEGIEHGVRGQRSEVRNQIESRSQNPGDKNIKAILLFWLLAT